MDYAVIVKGLNREGVHLHDEDPPASGERSVKDRKAGVKGWTIFSPPVKRYRSRMPDCARPV